MCGIAGVFTYNEAGDLNRPSEDCKRKMLDSILHRGPDGHGEFHEVEKGVLLLHSRLAIRDLTPTGKQPMISACGRFVITYNGEIYGERLREIVNQLSVRLKGTSDTEQLLEAVTESNAKSILSSIEGMFAFALYDRLEEKIIIARDRFGEKPLYYHHDKNRLIFSSELAGIMNFDDFTPEIDREACAAFMRHNYVPSPKSILKNVMKVMPGTFMVFEKSGKVTETSYFNPFSEYKERKNRFKGNLLDGLEQTLRTSVKERMISDVPIGCLLSGGIDSSLVAYFMQENSPESIDTFSIGFEREDLDEAPFAKKVSEILGTRHNELYVTESDLFSCVTELNQIYSEPFADSSQIPTLLVSRFARQKVSVVLTGDGGDELFGGYTRYAHALNYDSGDRTKHYLRKLISKEQAHRPILNLVEVLPGKMIDKLFGIENIKSKLPRYLKTWSGNEFQENYRRMVSHWYEPLTVINSPVEYLADIWNIDIRKYVKDELDVMRIIDMCTYLPDDILTKVDRASMSVGLETRAPFLDFRLFTLVQSFSKEELLYGKELKGSLKQLAYKLIGEKPLKRRKMGFGVPLSDWLRGPLRPWVEDLLHSENRGDLFNEPVVKSVWNRHLAGEDWAYWIWNYLILKDWIQKNPSVQV